MRKVTWVPLEDGLTDEKVTSGNRDEVHNKGECSDVSEIPLLPESVTEGAAPQIEPLVIEVTAEVEAPEIEASEAEISAGSVPETKVVKPSLRDYIGAAFQIDYTMVGDLLIRKVANTTGNAWEKCYPGAFWIRGERRLGGPSSKSECIGVLRPGLSVTIRVAIPRFPSGDKPDLLRIAILEDGKGWHTVEDIPVR